MTDVQLQDTTVRRAGVTARYWSRETQEVRCKTSNKLELYFEMSSKGGGTTAVLLQIGPKDFAALAKTMCAVDRQSAMAAMAAELAREITQQPEHEAALVQGARKSVADLAQEKIWQAPAGDNDAERLIWKGVSKLIEELSVKQKPKSKAA